MINLGQRYMFSCPGKQFVAKVVRIYYGAYADMLVIDTRNPGVHPKNKTYYSHNLLDGHWKLLRGQENE